MSFIVDFLVISSLVTLSLEIPSRVVFGKMVSDEIVQNYLNGYEKFNINPLDNSILSGDIDWTDAKRVIKKFQDNDYISVIRLGILSKYYIQGIGRVPVWSKSHKIIKELYKISEIK